jgi:hypothetical protein
MQTKIIVKVPATVAPHEEIEKEIDLFIDPAEVAWVHEDPADSTRSIIQLKLSGAAYVCAHSARSVAKILGWSRS